MRKRKRLSDKRPSQKVELAPLYEYSKDVSGESGKLGEGAKKPSATAKEAENASGN